MITEKTIKFFTIQDEEDEKDLMPGEEDLELGESEDGYSENEKDERDEEDE